MRKRRERERVGVNGQIEKERQTSVERERIGGKRSKEWTRQRSDTNKQTANE